MENEFSQEKITTNLRDPFHAKAFLAFLIITSLILPTTNAFGIPIKHLAFISFLFVLLSKWMAGFKINKNIIILIIASCIFCIFFLLLGALSTFVHFRYSLSESLQFLTTVAVGLSIIIAKSMHVAEDEEIISYTFYGIFFYTIWKSVAGLLVSLGIVNYYHFLNFLGNAFGYIPVGGAVYGNLYRINIIAPDFIATFFLLFIPCFPSAFSKIPILFQRIFIISGILCLVFSFSRLLFVMAALSWVYIFFFKFSFKQRFILVSLLVCVVAVASYWVQDVFIWTKEAFEERFVSSRSVHNKINDDVREDQTEALMNEWGKTPYLGGGFGYFAKNYIRSSDTPYTYEVQWVSFLMKFGIFGISFLIFLLLLIFYGILKGKRSSGHYVLVFTLLAYIVGSFTNQYAFSSVSSIFYIIHLNFASVLRKNMQY